MIGFFVRFSSYIKKPLTNAPLGLTKNPLPPKLPPTEENKELEEKIISQLSSLMPKDYSTFFDQLKKNHPEAMLPLIHTSIKNHIKALPSKNLEEICRDFPYETSSSDSIETLIKLILSIPGSLDKAKILVFISNVLRVKKIQAPLLENLKKGCRKIQINEFNHELVASISRSLKSHDTLIKISEFLQSNKSILLSWKIKTFFHINKEKAMDDAAKKYLLTFKDQFNKEEITVQNRLCDIYLTDKTFYPEFLDFLKENIGFFIQKATDRELLNIFNYLGVNFNYCHESIISSIYKSLEKRKLRINSMDAATLFHNLRKFALPVTPFLPLVTNEILSKSSGVEIAVLYHSLYKYLLNDKITLMKEKIIKDFDSLSPKHILNFAKDLVEDKNHYDKEFTDLFEKKAEEAFIKYLNPEEVVFKTQLITYYFLKHKNELNIDSDLGEE